MLTHLFSKILFTDVEEKVPNCKLMNTFTTSLFLYVTVKNKTLHDDFHISQVYYLQGKYILQTLAYFETIP